MTGIIGGTSFTSHNHVSNEVWRFGDFFGSAPGINLDTVEAMRNKDQLVALLRNSRDYVRKSLAAMPAGAMDAPSSIYGRAAPQWAILVQLVAHMNEHLGQSIAYARANNITPPWSQ